MWWLCATCNRNAEFLREKWISFLFHVQNKHKWNGNKKFKKCEHPRLTRKQTRAKESILPQSEAFEALQNIALDKKILGEYLTQFCHTVVLEVHHSLHNKWAPKKQHFSYAGMVARSQLPIMDFNKGSNLEQATTKTGEKRCNVQFSKITKNWSSKPVKEVKDWFSKPVKEAKDRSYLHQMVKETIENAGKSSLLEKPLIPKLPKNIASIAKPNKKDVIFHICFK